MAVEIGLCQICLSENRALVVLCDYLLAVRIVELVVLTPAIACISHCKMRSHFLYNKDRKLVDNIVFVRHHIRRSVCSYGELSYRQCIPTSKKIFSYKLLVHVVVTVVVTIISRYLSIFKLQLQVHIPEVIEIDLTHIQNSMSPREFWRSKHLADRNIYVCNTVFKVCLLCRIIQLVKHDQHVCLITAFTHNSHTICLVQLIYDILMYMPK